MQSDLGIDRIKKKKKGNKREMINCGKRIKKFFKLVNDH